MPNFSFFNSVATTSRVANALDGSPFEFVGRDSRVAIALGCAYVVGANQPDPGTVVTTITFGSELQLQTGAVPGIAALTSPTLPDNVVVDDVAQAGDRLVVELVNNDVTDAALINGIVRILPI